jgi:hypothetical protein
MLPKNLSLILALFALIGSAFAENSTTDRTREILGARGTYGAPPRLANGHVDNERLLKELRDIHANTYHWLIWTKTNDWDDLKLFLPKARAEKIKVWVTLVPPSESAPKTAWYSEPFRLDYVRWAEEFARLSLQETNLVAWSVDDFTHNLNFFTPEYLGKILNASREINPKLAFVPCCYFKAMTPQFAEKYAPLLDGILFPYRAESAGGNLKDSTLLEPEMEKLRALFGPKMPIILDVYATAHSRLGPSTPEYVEDLVKRGLKSCDGVLIYCHQDPKRSPEKYKVLKKVFGNSRK